MSVPLRFNRSLSRGMAWGSNSQADREVSVAAINSRQPYGPAARLYVQIAHSWSNYAHRESAKPRWLGTACTICPFRHGNTP
jgi:hypothetical protein